MKVALFDTGVDAKSFYQHFPLERITLHCFDVTTFNPDEWTEARVGDAACDEDGHGTHMASIIAQVACTPLL